MSRKVVVIGSGFGGLAIALRLQVQGYEVTIYEKRDKLGGRAYVIKDQGFTWDCGPTILTAPYLITELFELCGEKIDEHLKIVPLFPYYRIYFHDKTFFDYSANLDHQLKEVEKLSPGDKQGYLDFVKSSNKILQKGYIELGDYAFTSIWDMIKIAPSLLSLNSFKNMYSFAASFFKSEKLRRVFSFHSLLIGGNPLTVSSIYALIPALERKWGVHFAMGGTGAIVNKLEMLFVKKGGKIFLNSSVSKIISENKIAKGVVVNNENILADLVVSNADFAYTHLNLIDEAERTIFTNKKIKNLNHSMSCFVLFFGFKRTASFSLLHHNIILSENYRELLESIFERKILYQEFSQYLHIPSLTDPSLAPEGHHCAYTLIPTPHKTDLINWKTINESFKNKIIDFLDEHYIKDLKENLVITKTFNPDDFESNYFSYLGTGWGVEPRLTQSASFRPHNRSQELKNFYLVGASTQPGAGIPGVLMTAKITEKLIIKDRSNIVYCFSLNNI